MSRSQNELILNEAQEKNNTITYDFQFFVVSKKKLIIMMLLTSYLYAIYWFYQNWVRLKSAGVRCNPPLRSVFNIIFCYSLFRHIKNALNQHKIRSRYAPGLLAGADIVGSLMSVCRPGSELLPIIIFPIILLITNAKAKEINVRLADNPDIDKKFTWKNWFLILTWILIICIVATLPEGRI